ncbi:LuxR C-terminal-related transcriptional regulator [Mannheimia haemolytica]|nr:LuxR C-terminal-related transcriptional regulator [Mannheimia haemolytica]MDW0576191.1 LuxR C-terminal-related transcriptional regulator [Mannheimia haemolytica]MDW0578940.1 LuxR C-terminal-related transcriptional regulator [Mannheimia haemolytica]MDW0586747.1 LuxR C-terminal-related transcriptional regulator [Mannheimia haemolytica]MDW0605314.1 LuxR C-terminal-related transcriptional regulator [Mannheimia haemolytica]MDW0634179.1 LuxR C-terminal-related transcriptional regulator [Mannheimi
MKIREISQNYAKLTEKERNLVPLIMQGFTNKQIADKLAISVRTVEVHRANVMEKMQAESLAGLVQMIGELQYKGSGNCSATFSFDFCRINLLL